MSGSEATKNAATIGIGGGIAFATVLTLAYYPGGYVPGPVSRFDGRHQGSSVGLSDR